MQNQDHESNNDRDNEIIDVSLAMTKGTVDRIEQMAEEMNCEPSDIIAQGLRVMDRISRDIDSGSDVQMIITNAEKETQTVIDGEQILGRPWPQDEYTDDNWENFYYNK